MLVAGEFFEQGDRERDELQLEPMVNGWTTTSFIDDSSTHDIVHVLCIFCVTTCFIHACICTFCTHVQYMYTYLSICSFMTCLNVPPDTSVYGLSHNKLWPY